MHQLLTKLQNLGVVMYQECPVAHLAAQLQQLSHTVALLLCVLFALQRTSF